MKRVISFALIMIAITTLGCVSEKTPSEKTTPTATVTHQITNQITNVTNVNNTIPVNTTELDSIIKYLQEVENIDFNI